MCVCVQVQTSCVAVLISILGEISLSKPKLPVSSPMVCDSWYEREVHLKSGQGDAILSFRLLCTFKQKNNIEKLMSSHLRHYKREER